MPTMLASFPGLASAGSSTREYLSQDFYHASIAPLLVVTIFLAWLARPSTKEPIPEGFTSFRMRYLIGWCLCVAADWLQGPYVYALYSAYGYSKHENAQLFVAGFASSMLCGCFVGSMVDKWGRKRSALAYCLCYALSCMSKHFNSYGMLMVGRVLGGVSTSLLYSSFECWMVSEHLGRYKFSEGLLSYMFGSMFMLMYVVAILSGLIAQFVVEQVPFEPISEGSHIWRGGFLCPFDMAIVSLLCGAVHIAVCWDENYGGIEGGADMGVTEVFRVGLNALAKDRRLWMLACVVACFEGSMFAFVFNWTPALEDKETPPPLGLIFSAFMMACMCGSCLSTIAGKYCDAHLKLTMVCLAGVASFFVIVFATAQHQIRTCFLGFLFFEGLVGAYFPSVGVLKSEVVPENVRSTVYNIYRVPLNAVVVCLLLTNLSLLRCYGLCASLLMLAFIASSVLSQQRSAEGGTKTL